MTKKESIKPQRHLDSQSQKINEKDRFENIKPITYCKSVKIDSCKLSPQVSRTSYVSDITDSISDVKNAKRQKNASSPEIKDDNRQNFPKMNTQNKLKMPHKDILNRNVNNMRNVEMEMKQYISRIYLDKHKTTNGGGIKTINGAETKGRGTPHRMTKITQQDEEFAAYGLLKLANDLRKRFQSRLNKK